MESDGAGLANSHGRRVEEVDAEDA
jgi:hypothetical protein